MIKFLLGIVATIVVLLVAYMFTNKPSQTPKKKAISKVQKQDIAKVHEVKTSKKVILAAKSQKVASQDATQKMEKEIGEGFMSQSNQNEVADFSQIGKGLTLEGIQNSDVSEDEKDHMLTDLAAYQSYRDRNNPIAISEEEGLKVLTEEFN